MLTESQGMQPKTPSRFYSSLRSGWERWIVPRIASPLRRQRLKLLYYGFGYAGLLGVAGLSLRDRLALLARFLRIDWNVLHAHLPSEIVEVTRALAERRARPGEIMIEAGCWQGGSSTKFSLVCERLGYRLHIHDSFEGVEFSSPEHQGREWEFGGQYAAPEERVRENLRRYGALAVCDTRPGWFSETLAKAPVPHPVRVAYIDCDLGKGTNEVLRGVVPSLAEDGCIFSQDYHIEPVRRVLQDPETWRSLNRGVPRIRVLGQYLASLRFEPASRQT
jgi:O-methyltransferase